MHATRLDANLHHCILPRVSTRQTSLKSSSSIRFLCSWYIRWHRFGIRTGTKHSFAILLLLLLLICLSVNIDGLATCNSKSVAYIVNAPHVMNIHHFEIGHICIWTFFCNYCFPFKCTKHIVHEWTAKSREIDSFSKKYSNSVLNTESLRGSRRINHQVTHFLGRYHSINVAFYEHQIIIHA